eukprot:4045679-Amphidinium_carterae.1
MEDHASSTSDNRLQCAVAVAVPMKFGQSWFSHASLQGQHPDRFPWLALAWHYACGQQPEPLGCRARWILLLDKKFNPNEEQCPGLMQLLKKSLAEKTCTGLVLESADVRRGGKKGPLEEAELENKEVQENGFPNHDDSVDAEAEPEPEVLWKPQMSKA